VASITIISVIRRVQEHQEDRKKDKLVIQLLYHCPISLYELNVKRSLQPLSDLLGIFMVAPS
jgi:hypothetical protein